VETQQRRQQQVQEWLAGLMPGRPCSLAPASADASFRRYLRATFDTGETLVVMDAPPSHEDVRPWLGVQRLFREAGTHVPEVIAEDVERGFLLLSDLGSTTYLTALTDANADGHYRAAIDALARIQLASRPDRLPRYDRDLLKRELDLFPDWYLARHVGLSLSESQQAELASVFEKILAVNLAEPAVYVHRDYHSRNLMVAEPNPGIIDFQDAVFGPISYDLVSLFKDAYLEWPEERVLDWLIRYWQGARRAGLPVRPDFGDFHRDYEWMGVQRHVKVLGIFARLYHRDGKDGYLKDMPLVAKYLRAACERYRDLTPLLRLLDRVENRQVQAGYTF
jgi:aminoglycoside/choline kinase family phosphotransferase